jgi:uncharacterized protein
MVDNNPMNISLTETETRVLGSLLEKEMATPDYYPLSLNGLVNACNQKTNREPVVSYDEDVVVQALNSLREKRLVWQSDASRVPKYAQNLSATLNLLRKESALLCLLLLRGPQTGGELRSRSERLYDFSDLDEIFATLKNLEEMGLVRTLPRQPGRKELRYTHLLGSEQEEHPRTPVAENPALPEKTGDVRLAAVEEELASLKAEVEELRRELRDFKSQF